MPADKAETTYSQTWTEIAPNKPHCRRYPTSFLGEKLTKYEEWFKEHLIVIILPTDVRVPVFLEIVQVRPSRFKDKKFIIDPALSLIGVSMLLI